MRFQELEQESCQWARAESTRLKECFDRAAATSTASPTTEEPSAVAVVPSAGETTVADTEVTTASTQTSEMLSKIINNMCLDQTCSINKNAVHLRSNKAKPAEILEADAILAG